MSIADKLREEGKLVGIKEGFLEGLKEGIKEGRKEEIIETILILINNKLPKNKFPKNIESKLNKLDLIILTEIRTNLIKNIINIDSLEDFKKYLN